MKKSKFQTKVLVPLIGALCITSPFAIGFSMWAATGGYDGMASGMFRSDDVNQVDNPVKTFTIQNSPSFTALAGRGFLNTSTKEYVNYTTLTWQCSFNSSKASGMIDSLIFNNRFWCSISITISNTPSLISNFSISDMTLSNLGTATVIQQNGANTNKDETQINEQWNITNISMSTGIIFTVTVPITYTGSLSNFPNLNTNKITINLLPGEYKNV
ncbi:MAG: hypothetical protein K6C32_01710 [Bacilli bacterium]|nr:hypothetical protein [Bacilli bacterium]